MQPSAEIEKTNAYLTRVLELIHGGPSCKWCKHPEQTLYRAGFCRHCYGISREVLKLELHAQKLKRGKQLVSSDLSFHLGTARKMVYLAQVEGANFGNIHKKTVVGLNLELQFSQLSKALIRKDLYDGKLASFFEENFSLVQKRFIYYLLSMVIRQRERKARRSAAMDLVARDPIDRRANRRLRRSP